MWLRGTGRLVVGCAAAYLCRVDSLVGVREVSDIVRVKCLWLWRNRSQRDQETKILINGNW